MHAMLQKLLIKFKMSDIRIYFQDEFSLQIITIFKLSEEKGYYNILTFFLYAYTSKKE